MAVPAHAVTPSVTLAFQQVVEPEEEQPGGYSLSDGLTNIYGVGAVIGLAVSCTGTGCRSERPARWEKSDGGPWRTVRTGTLGDFLSDAHTWDTNADIQREFLTVDTSKPATLNYRLVLPAWGSLGEARIASSQGWRIRPATNVRITGVDGVWDSAGLGAGIFHYCIRRSGKNVPTMTVRVSPADERSGTLQYIKGNRVVADGVRTNAKGILRVDVPETGSEARLLRVNATADRAGFSVYFSTCPTT